VSPYAPKSQVSLPPGIFKWCILQQAPSLPLHLLCSGVCHLGIADCPPPPSSLDSRIVNGESARGEECATTRVRPDSLTERVVYVGSLLVLAPRAAVRSGQYTACCIRMLITCKAHSKQVCPPLTLCTILSSAQQVLLVGKRVIYPFGFVIY
jgi:hypothetical protein